MVGEGEAGLLCGPHQPQPNREKLGEATSATPRSCASTAAPRRAGQKPRHRTYHNEEGLSRDDLQPLHRHAVLREQLPVQVRRWLLGSFQLTKWPSRWSWA
jgi:hypothetical protein